MDGDLSFACAERELERIEIRGEICESWCVQVYGHNIYRRAPGGANVTGGAENGRRRISKSSETGRRVTLDAIEDRVWMTGDG